MEEGNSFRMNGQKILVVRFSAMGDIVLTSPVVRLLKMQLNADVHFLTKDIFANLWRENPYLSKIWTIDKDLKEVISALKKEKFDAVIDLHSNFRTLIFRFYLFCFFVQVVFSPILSIRLPRLV
jgi:ADP-heptose:LPS heptosyltransferase